MPKPLDRNDIRRAFAATVRELRSRRDIAQEKLAYEAGVDRGYMGALERAVSTPTLDTIFKLLPVLDVDFVSFAGEFIIQLKGPPKRRPRAAPPAPPSTDRPPIIDGIQRRSAIKAPAKKTSPRSPSTKIAPRQSI